jgi:fructose-1-phosphate kinase PfkB-like protein
VLDVPATSGADIERHIEAHRPPDIKASVEEVRDYAYKALVDLKSLIRCITQTKSKLAQHVKDS